MSSSTVKKAFNIGHLQMTHIASLTTFTHTTRKRGSTTNIPKCHRECFLSPPDLQTQKQWPIFHQSGRRDWPASCTKAYSIFLLYKAISYRLLASNSLSNHINFIYSDKLL